MRLIPGLRTTSTFGRERYESRYIPANRKRSSTECRKIACVRERASRIEDPLFSHRVVLFFILSPRREATTRPFIRSLSYMYFCISPVKPPQIFSRMPTLHRTYFISRDSLSLAPFSFLMLYFFLFSLSCNTTVSDTDAKSRIAVGVDREIETWSRRQTGAKHSYYFRPTNTVYSVDYTLRPVVCTHTTSTSM